MEIYLALFGLFVALPTIIWLSHVILSKMMTAYTTSYYLLIVGGRSYRILGSQVVIKESQGNVKVLVDGTEVLPEE